MKQFYKLLLYLQGLRTICRLFRGITKCFIIGGENRLRPLWISGRRIHHSDFISNINLLSLIWAQHASFCCYHSLQCFISDKHFCSCLNTQSFIQTQVVLDKHDVKFHWSCQLSSCYFDIVIGQKIMGISQKHKHSIYKKYCYEWPKNR